MKFLLANIKKGENKVSSLFLKYKWINIIYIDLLF